VLAKLIILESITLQAVGHLSWFELSKDKGTNVILENLDVHLHCIGRS
jgi:hypothetical protein